MNALERARRIRRGEEAESGFALVFTMMVITMATLAVIGVTAVVIPTASDSKRGWNTMAASAAARAGIDDVIAYLVSIPSCRSETRICPAALGASSEALKNAGKTRPSLGNGQSFSWTTGSEATDDGYLRVTSKGTSGNITRTLVADLSLQPSILAYGYYSDYETQAPDFFTGYYKPRDIYVSNQTTYSKITDTYENGATAPQTVRWNGPTNTDRCGRHWYAENGVSGRASNGTTWSEAGTNNVGTSRAKAFPARSGSCDLVFTSAMNQNGRTFTRDAINVSSAGGNGPVFNQPVYTMWGYDDGVTRNTTPAPTAGKIYRGDSITGSPNLPAVAAADLRLPSSIGKDGVPEDACVYTGPTRVVLNGDGTATVTSPFTTTKNPASDPACYPSGTLPGTGILKYTLRYNTVGGGTIQVKDLGTAPSSGWPAVSAKATQTPGAGNEVMWLPASATTSPDPATAAAPDAGCSTTGWSNAVNAPCAWTNVKSTTDGNSGTTQGWTANTTTTGTKCSTTTSPTDRLLFECEYSGTAAGAARPTTDQYALVRTAVKNLLASGQCSGTVSDQTSCIGSWLNDTGLRRANTGGRAIGYTAAANGDHQYIAVAISNTGQAGATKNVGNSPANPMAGDPLFAYTGTPAQETATDSPISVAVYRQTYSSSTKKWGGTAAANVPQFAFTTTRTDWAISKQATGAGYFPDEHDVTAYNTGTNPSNATAYSAGVNQPGDLYVQGNNSGKLSLLADEDVILTGDLKNPDNYAPEQHAVSIVAGDDVRNYHPVTCDDQVAADINNTTAGFCPNDLLGASLSSALITGNNAFDPSHPAMQYDNVTTGDRVVQAAVFALDGSLRTDNYDRGSYVGNLNIQGGVYQSHRGANGVQYTSGNYIARTGTTLQYTYVDLQRAELPYVPPATSGNYTRPWNIVSVSAGA